MTKFARVGGQSVTIFQWDSQTIAFAHQVSVQSPQPVGQTTPIHPLNARRPVQLITPFATSMGTLELELYELFGRKIWEDLAGYIEHRGALSRGTGDNKDVYDLSDLFVAIGKYAAENEITIKKIVSPYGKRGNKVVETYHNCVISTVQDSETIEIGTMEILKRITVNYTKSTWTRESFAPNRIS